MFGNSVSRAYHDFPGHGQFACPGKLNRSSVETQTSKLVFTLRQFQEGRKVTGPFRWACTQNRYGPGPRACMGLGLMPVWALGSQCHTNANPKRYSTITVNIMSVTKAIKGERKRESESETQRERNRDRLKFQSNNKTQHLKIPKFSKPNN